MNVGSMPGYGGDFSHAAGRAYDPEANQGYAHAEASWASVDHPGVLVRRVVAPPCAHSGADWFWGRVAVGAPAASTDTTGRFAGLERPHGRYSPDDIPVFRIDYGAARL